MRKKGDRVGAIKSANDKTVYLYGYGVYVGDEVPPKGVKIMGLDLNEINRQNPKIVLDDGNVIWGCQCWWGTEDQVRDMIGNRQVVMVPVPSCESVVA